MFIPGDIVEITGTGRLLIVMKVTGHLQYLALELTNGQGCTITAAECTFINRVIKRKAIIK